VHKLFWNDNFLSIISIWNGHIHFGTQTRGKSGNGSRRLAQPNHDTDGLLNRKDGANTVSLNGKFFAIDEFASTNNGFELDIDLVTTVENDTLELWALDLDRYFFTVENINLLFGVCDFDLLFCLILDDPFGPSLSVLENRKTTSRLLLHDLFDGRSRLDHNLLGAGPPSLNSLRQKSAALWKPK
jgi:hypothetical protein